MTNETEIKKEQEDIDNKLLYMGSTPIPSSTT